MKLEKDLNNLVFKFETDNNEGYVYTPLEVITEKDILKNSAIFNMFIEKMKDAYSLKNEMLTIGINLKGYIYTEIEKLYSKEDDSFIDKKYNSFISLLDSLYLNSKIWSRGKEYTSIEFESKEDKAFDNMVRFQILFFLLTSLLSSVKKIKTNEKIGTIQELPDVYLTSLDFGGLITYIQNSKKED